MNYSQSESREMCGSDVDVQHPFITIKSKEGGGAGKTRGMEEDGGNERNSENVKAKRRGAQQDREGGLEGREDGKDSPTYSVL